MSDLIDFQSASQVDDPDQARTEMVCELLREEGFRPQIDSDGDIMVRVAGKTHFVFVDESFLRIWRPAVWSIDCGSEWRECAKACSKVNSKVKKVKAYFELDDEYVSLSYDTDVITQNLGEQLTLGFDALAVGQKVFNNYMLTQLMDE